MANIAAMLKGEITRLARKEVRVETARLQKTSSAYRSEIATLKRRLTELERQVKRNSNGSSRSSQASVADGSAGPIKGRFSAKSMRSQRKRLGLTAAEMGVLLGSSAQSVYNWEEGKIRPQARHLPAIFALRDFGRKEVKKLLDEHAAAA
jgi:DNA-binding transcriptional regulator YiaG